MTYRRVVPRDLFNEADLLKCYGRLWILLDERRDHSAVLGEGDGSPFDIQQDPNSGALTIANLQLTIAGCPYRLHRPLNSRRAWPLYASDEADEVEVFDPTGNFSNDFADLIGLKSEEPHA